MRRKCDNGAAPLALVAPTVPCHAQTLSEVHHMASHDCTFGEGCCLGCGKPGMKRFKSSGRYKRYCSSECCRRRMVARRETAVRNCVRCGEPFTVDSSSDRTACLSCSRRKYFPVCLHCGQAYRPKESDRLTYCSRGCAYAHKRRREEQRQIEQTKPDGYVLRCGCCTNWFFTTSGRATVCSDRCSRRRNYIARRALKGGTLQCQYCGHTVTVQSHLTSTARVMRKYCSKQCRRKAKAKARSALERYWSRRACAERAGESIPPTEIFLRDGYRCQYCKCKVRTDVEVPHPRRATLDHIMPISNGGTHTRANLQTACFNCNCVVKRDRIEGNQLRLF